MAVAIRELEGTWDEILEHAHEFSGRRLRVQVLESEVDGLTERQRSMLAWIDRRRKTSLTEEEVRVLDEFEEFRRQHPIRFRRLDLDE